MTSIIFGSPAAAKLLRANKLQDAIDAIDWDVVYDNAEVYDPSDDDDDDDDDWYDFHYGAEVRVKLLDQSFAAVGVAYDRDGAISDAVDSLKNILRRKVAQLSAEAVSN